MKRLLLYLKNKDIQFPIPVGALLAKVPFKYRPGLGKLYKEQLNYISNFSDESYENKQKFIFQRVFPIFKHAFDNIPFYNKFYKGHGISPKDIRSFEDIDKIPILRKSDLIDVPLEERSFPIKGRAIVNTGGSSGKPLSFYMDAKRFGNEWSHIHYIWSMLGVKPSDMRLKFDGRNSVRNLLQYDFIRNMFRYNIYVDPALCADHLLKINEKYKIALLHGYPSAIFDFASYCRDYNNALLHSFKNSLKGIHLVSEFPNPYFRNEIENIFDVPAISSYGHTETCVLAFEREEPFSFWVFQTYGYAEALEVSNDNYSLVGTSYFNYASPLIRYDTEDRISQIRRVEGILENFHISEGRNGEYILDLDNRKIPLTGLIFGRHHKIFDVAKYVQVYQPEVGKATILYVSNKIGEISSMNRNLFDGSNVKIEFDFRKIDRPIYTPSGKVNLLVKNLNESIL